MTAGSVPPRSAMPAPRPRHAPAARTIRARAAAAFTLIETALATIIIAVGVLALIEAQQTFLRSNAWSTESATAHYFANEIRERLRTLPRHDPQTGLELVSGALVGWGIEADETEIADFDDLDDFDGLRLAFNGTAGTADGDLQGPIDAMGAVIPQIDNTGAVVLDDQDRPLPLQGWTQRITVRKVDPRNWSTIYPDEQTLAADGIRPAMDVDDFPLRVEVEVTFQGPNDAVARPISRVVWIVP